MEPAITVAALSKRFGDRQVLDQVSFSVARGETLVVLGRSGTGKSVLLRCLIGLLQPDAGRALVLGRDLNALTESERLHHRRKIGYVFQGSALFDSLSILENVGFPLFERRQPPERIRAKVVERLRMVGLEHTIDQYPAELSGGMRKRAALARALIELPEVVLYDEPTTGLDPLTTDVINQIILRLRSSLQVTSVVVTHDIKSAFTIADRILMIDAGRVVCEGTPAEIETCQSPWVHRFITGQALESEMVESGMFAVGQSSALLRNSGLLAARPSESDPLPAQTGQLTGSVRRGAIRNRSRKPGSASDSGDGETDAGAGI